MIPRLRVRFGARPAAWALLALAIGLYVLLSVLVGHQPFHVGARRLKFFDLRVYRGAAQLVLDGRSVYDGTIFGGLGFTYPPFAALVFTPLALLPLAVDELLLSAASLGAIVCILRFVLRIRAAGPSAPGRHRITRLDAWTTAPVAAAAALWLEPITTTLGYGQIDLLVVLLVVWDLSRSDEARGKGAAIGVAAGLKLTPLLFIAYLLLAGRRRAAGVAGGVFLATIAAGFALLPADAARFWGGVGFDAHRIGAPGDTANQSLEGLLTRLTHASGTGTGWVIVAGVTAALGLAAAVRASREGDEAIGLSLCALTALLISPVSWTHHWTMALPSLFLVALAAYEERSQRKLLALAVCLVVGYSYVPEWKPGPPSLDSGVGSLLGTDPYVLVGLVGLSIGCLAQFRSMRALSARGRCTVLPRSP